MVEYYEILGIPLNASKNEVKLAYRRLAMEFHPDVCKHPDAGVRFIEISIAYQSIIKKMEYQENIGYSSRHVASETAQDIIDTWLAAEKERLRKRAQKHASMSYNQFKRSKLYKSSVFFPKILAYLSLGFGMAIIAGSTYGTWQQSKIDPDILTATYLGSAILVFLIGIIITVFAVTRLLPFFKKHQS